MGGRLRHSRRKAIIGGLLSAAAVATALSGCVSQRPGVPTPSAAPSPSLSTIDETPQQLAGGWQVVAAGSRVLDRSRNAYVRMNMPPGAILDPTGRRHVTGGEQLDIVELVGDKVITEKRRITLGFGLGLDPWSPDGSRVVGTIDRKEPHAMGFAVTDVATGKTTEHWFSQGYNCSMCSFVFTRDGKEVALPIADRSQGEAAELVQSLQLFDAQTGRPTRELLVKAMPQSPFAWSPDGRQVVALTDQRKQEDVQLIDTTTGEAKPFPYLAVWATADALLAKFDDGVLTLRPDGTVVADASLSDSMSGPLVLGPPAA
ncbi:TolB family protein [Catellatospora chokoriensis]|uniref:WD40 repeat protein n=1 Tax=Catellatospora chokoriensis TaxID=310353 RepID=A0A8J3K2I3_9ACTN|nr:hypothetical protein [Catellatospora chokoriensis]GIF91801.1 hypothetical protein Cch02nite_52450 [Catellatospora chokoriensis]